MTIAALPTPPAPTDNIATFNSKAFALLQAFPDLVDQINTTGDSVNTKYDDLVVKYDAAIAAGLPAAASNAGAAASSAAAALATRTAIDNRYRGALSADPATRTDGSANVVGDEVFNSTAGLLKRWNGSTWQASDLNTANLAASGGSALVGYDGGTVQDVLDNAKPMASYAALRAYTGRASGIRITTPGIAGIFQRDATDAATLDNGGTVIVDSSTRRWKRSMVGVSASPYWFELPLVSSGVDYTDKLQAVLDCLSFEFPQGFESSCKTLYPRSNSVGDFKNAKFTLLNAQPAGTQMVVLGTAAFAKCENSVFYGGVFDGNKANNTAANNPGTIAGGDGGMHGLQLHHARSVRWYGPKFNNCGTDGIYVHQQRAGEAYGPTDLTDVHIYSPVCDGNGRQGISVISCDDVHIYDGTFTNTSGKLPMAGIDVEGNTTTDSTDVYFHGKTTCTGNDGRGFMVHSSGNVVNVTFDDLICKNNTGSAVDGQVWASVSGDGINTVRARKIEIIGNTSYSLGSSAGGGASASAKNSWIVGAMSGNKPFNFGPKTLLSLGSIDATSASTAGDLASVMFYGGEGTIQQINAVNTSGNQNGFTILLLGSDHLTIRQATSTGARGVNIQGQYKQIDELVIKGALTGSGLFLLAASKNKVNALMVGTLTGDYPMRLSGACDDNDLSIVWDAATQECATISGSRNKVKVKSIRTAGDAALALTSTSFDCLVHSSLFKGQTGTGFITNTGTGNVIAGCLPKTVNAP